VEAKIPSFAELSLPEKQLIKLASQRRGLILVTGNTGSGKSTTLATMINHINANFNRHIISIEDPIEFMFKDKKSIIDQREVNIDTPSFGMALKYAVRQSPDVVLIGEMRDRETMEAALSAAEIGHLVLSTLHPPHQHNLIRLQLSLILIGVVSQRLIPRKKGGGRIPAIEILMQTPTTSEMLAEGKTRELYGALRDGEYFGCQTFNQSLRKLYQGDMISLEDALGASDYPDELKLELKGVYKGTSVTDFNFEY